MNKIQEIKKIIAKGNIKEAFKQINKLSLATKQEEDILLLESQFNSAAKQNRVGLISHEAYMSQSNRIAYALLSILNEISKEVQDGEQAEIENKTKGIDMDMNKKLKLLISIWQEVRFDASVSRNLKDDLGQAMRALQEYSKMAPDPLYDVDGKIGAMLESMVQGFYDSHSLELKKRRKVAVAKLKELVLACEDAPTAYNGAQLAGALWVHDSTLDFRQRFADVSHSFPAMGKVMGEMADAVEGLWDEVKND